MLKPIETAVARISMVLGGVVLLAMMLQVVIDVFMRAFLGAGFPATADLVGKYYMVAVSVLPLAMTELKRRHIEATVFTEKLTGWPLRAVLLLGLTIFGAVLAVLLWGSTVEALSKTARRVYVEAGTMRFPTWPSYWILPVSFGLALLVNVIRLIELFTGRFAGAQHDPLDELESRKENA